LCVHAELPGRADAAARLWWGLKRYALIGLVTVAAVVAASAVFGLRSRPTEYKASAIVIAKHLAISPEGLPRLSETLFNAARVARTAVRIGHLPFAPALVIPNHASLEPVVGTIVLRVVGNAQSADLAARTATSVAAALIDELNRPGRGVGVFALQEPAAVPSRPVHRRGAAFTLAVALIAGLLLGVGFIALIVATRKPLITPAEATAIAGAAVLGAPALRRRNGDPRAVAGIAAITERLGADDLRACAFVAARGAERQASQISALVASVLGRARDVKLIPAQDAVAHPRSEGDVLVIDGPAAASADALQLLPSGTVCVLVLREGTRAAVLEEAAEQFPPGALRGLVFVRRSRLFRRRRAMRVAAITEGAASDRAGSLRRARKA